MRVRSFSDPEAFERSARPVLMAAPGRNNLVLGILSTLVEHPQVYPTFDLWLAETGGRPVGAALRTHPLNVVLADPIEPAAVDALCDAVPPDVPGVVANRPWDERFLERFGSRTGARAELRLAQGVFELTRVRDPRPATGVHRRCVAADRDLLRRWMAAFTAEALAHQPPDPDRTDRMLDVRLTDAEDAGLWFWEVDGEPVSLAGYGDAGPTGMRVGPVFTPGEHRGRGYASNLVAVLSRWGLEQGKDACYLYTDLGNPTSNGIYVAVGYERVGESAEHAFVR